MKQDKTLASRLDAFIVDEILPRHHDMQAFVRDNRPGARPAFLDDLKERARAQGLWNLGLPVLPQGAPGTVMSNTEFAPIAEKLAQVYWSSEVFNCHAPDLPNMEMLESLGTDEQRERWLLPLLEGRIKSGFGMTEPETASSDARNIACRIDTDGDDFVINGHKWFVGNANVDGWDFVVVIGQTDPDAGPHERHSAVIVPVDTPGFTVVREVPTLGFQHRFRPHGEVVLRDVRVPQSYLLGKRGRGFAAAQVRLATARIHHCMRNIGGAELVLSLMVERSRKRVTFGKPLAERDKIQEFIALSRIEIEQARLLTLHAAQKIDAEGGRAAYREISMIKLAVARACFAVADRAVQVFGAMGITDDSPVADFFTQMRAFRIYDGPDEVHMRTIARLEDARQNEIWPNGLMHLFCTDFSAPERLPRE